MDAQKEWTEICQLRRKIEEAGLKKQEFHSVANNIQEPDEDPLEFCTQMRIHHSRKPVPFRENLDRQSKDVGDLREIVDAFLQKLAELIWWHNQRKKPEFYRAVFEQDEWDLLEGLRQQLEALPEKGYSQKALPITFWIAFTILVFCICSVARLSNAPELTFSGDSNIKEFATSVSFDSSSALLDSSTWNTVLSGSGMFLSIFKTAIVFPLLATNQDTLFCKAFFMPSFIASCKSTLIRFASRKMTGFSFILRA